MTKSYYTYASRKSKTFALILNLLGIVLGIVSLLIELPRRNHSSMGGQFVGFMDAWEMSGLWYSPFLPILAIVLLIVACVLSCVAIYKKTTLTLPALIVSSIAYVYTDALICFFAPKGTVLNLLLSAILLLAAWIVFACGHGKVSKGQRNKKLLLAGFCSTLAVLFVLCVFQTAVSVNGAVEIDWDSELAAQSYGYVTGYDFYQIDEDAPPHDREFYVGDDYGLYDELSSNRVVIDYEDYIHNDGVSKSVISLYGSYGITADTYLAKWYLVNGMWDYYDLGAFEYVIEYFEGGYNNNDQTMTVFVHLYHQVKYYESGYLGADDVFNMRYPDVDFHDYTRYAYKYEEYVDWYGRHESLYVYEIDYVTQFPNIFAYLAAACVAVAYYVLGRSELAETVVESVRLAKYGANGSGDTASAGAPELTLTTQNVALNVFLTLITFGIYGYVWFYRNAQRVRQINGESEKGCGDELLLYIFGGLLYRMYWYYTHSKQINTTVKKLGYDGIFLSPMLYLLLSVFTPTVFQLAFLSANFNTLYHRVNVGSEKQGKASEEAMVHLAKRHGLLKVVLLGIVTFGIYFIITQVRIVNRIKLMQGKQAANKTHLICMFLVPFYWIFWLITFKGKYHEGSNEATLEAWLLIVVPFYSIYWLITRTAELRVGAEQFGVIIAEEAVWTLLFAMIAPVVCYANMLININRVADAISIAA